MKWKCLLVACLVFGCTVPNCYAQFTSMLEKSEKSRDLGNNNIAIGVDDIIVFGSLPIAYQREVGKFAIDLQYELPVMRTSKYGTEFLTRAASIDINNEFIYSKQLPWKTRAYHLAIYKTILDLDAGKFNLGLMYRNTRTTAGYYYDNSLLPDTLSNVLLRSGFYLSAQYRMLLHKSWGIDYTFGFGRVRLTTNETVVDDELNNLSVGGLDFPATIRVFYNF
jgi:hypothetical protein